MIKAILRFINNIRVKLAIRKAEKLRKLTRRQYLVINWKNSPMVLTRKHLKELVRLGFFVKGISLGMIEKAAIYKTY